MYLPFPPEADLPKAWQADKTKLRTSGFRLSRYALSLTRHVETVEKAFIVLKSPAEVLDSQA